MNRIGHKHTREELEMRAAVDFTGHLGRELDCDTLWARDAFGCAYDIMCNPPARVKVKSAGVDLNNWNDDWLDPHWRVEVVGTHPIVNKDQTLFVFGPSYCLDGKLEPRKTWRLVPRKTLRERIRRWLCL